LDAVTTLDIVQIPSFSIGITLVSDVRREQQAQVVSE